MNDFRLIELDSGVLCKILFERNSELVRVSCTAKQH